jgi:2-(1,2-epoxy-1,2-dihydrophenyl)acetyl-CoA isomerase
MSARQQPVGAATVIEERSGAVMTLKLNRPQKLNALVPEMGQALVRGLVRAAEDETVQAVMITGAGRAFCSGGDLELLRDVRKRKAMSELQGLLLAGKEICVAIATMSKPVIAAVNGPAAGGGMNLALACDVRIASTEAKFAESFAKVGLYPDFGGTYFLPRIVGPALAAELFYAAELLTAEDALRLGIVNRVVAAGRFEEEAGKLAANLAGSAPLAVGNVKRTMLTADRRALEARLDEEVRMQIECFESEDCLEALNAFFEKRKPNFCGS